MLLIKFHLIHIWKLVIACIIVVEILLGVHKSITEICESVIIHHVVINEVIITSKIIVKLFIEFLERLVTVIIGHEVLKLVLWNSSISIHILNAHVGITSWTTTTIKRTCLWDIRYVIHKIILFCSIIILFWLKLLLVFWLTLWRCYALLRTYFSHSTTNTWASTNSRSWNTFRTSSYFCWCNLLNRFRFCLSRSSIWRSCSSSSSLRS